MPTRITVSFVNPPKPGKTNGSIKTRDDQLYGVKPDMLSLFQPKGVYDIEFTSRMFNDKPYNTVTSVKHAQDAAPAAAGGKYGATDTATAERIFVCGALNAAISGGHTDLNTEHLTNLVNIFRLVWDDTLGADSKKQKPGEDMGGDDIPF